MSKFIEDVAIRVNIVKIIQDTAEVAFDFFGYVCKVHSNLKLVFASDGIWNNGNHAWEENGNYGTNTCIVSIYPLQLIDSFGMVDSYKLGDIDIIKTLTIHTVCHEIVHSQQEIDRDLYNLSKTYKNFIETSCEYRTLVLITSNIDLLMAEFDLKDMYIGRILTSIKGHYGNDLSMNYRILKLEDLYVDILRDDLRDSGTTNDIYSFISVPENVIIRIIGMGTQFMTNDYHIKTDGVLHEPEIGLLDTLRFYQKVNKCTRRIIMKSSDPLDSPRVNLAVISIEYTDPLINGLIKYDEKPLYLDTLRKPLIKYDEENG